jgi:uncharacterized protein YecE (DUF72 family)
VEAATSYYGLPKKEVIAAWAASTPKGFSISAKLPDWALTRKGRELDAALAKVLENLEPLRKAGKLGTLVAQFPPRYHHDKRAEELRAFVSALPTRRARWAVELRHGSWWREETYDMLREAGVTLVWSELGEGFRTPPVATTDRLYLRLFGDRALAPPWSKKRRDASRILRQWAARIAEAPRGVTDVDVLVSKFLEGHPAETASVMQALLGPPARASKRRRKR